ncbi:MAG: MarR family winged helix-turn-helix transcriptional regulator [Acutalibacteraceae bacterium]
MNRRNYIFGAIFALSNRLQIIGDSVNPGMTIKQWLFLAMISKSGSDNPALNEIAAIMGCSRQNVKKMAVILEKNGFVTMRRDANDARVTRVSLTEQCGEYFKKHSMRDMEFMDALFEGFSAQDIANLFDGLKKIENNIIKIEKQKGDNKQ